ncbi:zinc finger protein 471-like [Culex pipiens pallens]|uniref:zinc finger protein 471-like n=1 Tax=Culex pipiens pallens TaxID=42434 RepID=UPI00195358FC|nr:zinc finger protein 471-like [Culex pipiens pallens]
MEPTSHCRICHRPEDPSVPLRSIYSSDESEEIVKMLEELNGGQLIVDELRSSEICATCLQKVHIGYAIQRQIREAEATPATSSTELVLPSGTVVKVEDVFIEEEEEDDGYEYEFLEDEYLEEDQPEPVQRVVRGRFFIMPKEEVVRGVVEHVEGYREVQVEGDRCCGCSFVGVNRKELLQHSDKAHVIDSVGSGNYCPICFGKFAREETLTRHIDECRSRSIFVCGRCNRYFNRRGKIERHLAGCKAEEVAVPGEEAEESDTMEIEFETGSEWEEEEEFKPVEDKLRRKVVPKLRNVVDVRFSEGLRIDNLQESQIVTRITFQTFQYVKLHGERCCGCDFFCEKREELFRHAREAHEAVEGLESLLKCSICCVEFEDNRKLQQHINFTTSKELLICTICDEAFSGTGHLLYHQETSLSHKDLCVAQKAPILELKDKSIREELVRLSSNDKDPTRHRNNNRSITRHRHLSLPEPCFITDIDDFPNYQIITVSGERCCGCGQFFQTFKELVEHGRRDHLLEHPEAAGGYQCDICFSRFMYDRGLILHQSTRRSLDKMYHCTICNLVFSKQYSITKHLQSAPNHNLEQTPKPNPNQFHCCFPKCAPTFPSEDLLLEHCISEHAGKRRENESERTNEANVCAGCLKSFENTTTLVWHRTMRFTKRYTCRFCPLEFTRWPAFRDHENQVHLGKSIHFPCETCGKLFRNAHSLKAHGLIHSEARSEVCDECGAAFRNKGVLKRHKRAVHAAEFRFDCVDCGKKFPTREQMQAHSRVHTGVKPYPCRFCERAFKHFTDRKRHEMSTHTGERPYKCAHCSAAYIRNRELVIHLQKHNGEGKGGEVEGQ